MTDDQATAAAEPRQLTRNDISRRYGARVWEAIERRDELDRRYHSARAEATLKARGTYDPAKHGAAHAEPLTTAEHLERIALDEHISRHYQPHYELDEALKSGATLAQVADALGIHEDTARERIRSWAEGQHNLWNGYSEHRFGLSDDDYAAVLARTADPETYPGGTGDPANIGIRDDREAPGGWDLGPDEDGAPAGNFAPVMFPDEAAVAALEAEPDDLPDSALPAAADYVGMEAAEVQALEAGKTRAEAPAAGRARMEAARMDREAGQ